MRIYRERIPTISRQIVAELVRDELIEVEAEFREESVAEAKRRRAR